MQATKLIYAGALFATATAVVPNFGPNFTASREASVFMMSCTVVCSCVKVLQFFSDSSRPIIFYYKYTALLHASTIDLLMHYAHLVWLLRSYAHTRPLCNGRSLRLFSL